MNRLIIRGEPTQIFQRISVIKNNEKVEGVGVQIDDFEEVVFQCLEKYNIKNIDLSGPRAYTEGLERKIRQAGVTQYDITDLTFRYV